MLLQLLTKFSITDMKLNLTHSLLKLQISFILYFYLNEAKQKKLSELGLLVSHKWLGKLGLTCWILLKQQPRITEPYFSAVFTHKMCLCVIFVSPKIYDKRQSEKVTTSYHQMNRLTCKKTLLLLFVFAGISVIIHES